MIKEQTSKETFSKAYDLVRSGKYIEAEPLLCKLLDRHPDHPDVLHLMGLVFLETYRLDDSVHAFKSAVENCPDQARYHYHYGLSLIRKNDIDNAISSFNTALALDGDFQDARYNLAKALKDQGDLEKSATIYEQLLEKEPLHADALYNLANLRYEMDMLSESENLFRQLLSKNPKHLNARTNYALIQSRTGRTEEAIRILEKTLSIDPNHKSARQLLQKLYSSKIPSWHFDMLNDEKRNDAYDRAIRKTVVNANQVLEIGTGSGLLSMMAARAGARKVVTCEMCRFLAKIAEKIIEKNGFADRIRVINKKSTQLKIGVDLFDPADVLIVEVFDNGLLGEHFLPSLLHAKKNLLKEKATIVPATATVYAMLIECPRMRRINPIGNIAGFDLSDFDIFRNTGYKQVILKNIYCKELCEPIEVFRIDFELENPIVSKRTIKIQINQDGICQAIVFWFELVLWKDIKLSTFDDSHSNHWKQALQFFKEDHPVFQGDIVDLDVVQDPTGLKFTIN